MLCRVVFSSIVIVLCCVYYVHLPLCGE